MVNKIEDMIEDYSFLNVKWKKCPQNLSIEELRLKRKLKRELKDVKRGN